MTTGSPPAYRDRLRVEGLTLAATGAAGSALLLVAAEEARRWPLSTVGQLTVVAGLLAALGPRMTRRALEASRPVDSPDELGGGEPTPLWHLPAVCAGLTLLVSLPDVGRAGWDAGLRVTAGCALFGLYQAFGIERQVAADEARTGRRHVRGRGSRLGRGSALVHLRAGSGR